MHVLFSQTRDFKSSPSIIKLGYCKQCIEFNNETKYDSNSVYSVGYLVSQKFK